MEKYIKFKIQYDLNLKKYSEIINFSQDNKFIDHDFFTSWLE